jgi:glycosyltransferase involved in cell wall biosynthesis
MRIAVCSAQIPFEYGAAEALVRELVDELRRRDHEAELVSVPFKWYPGTRVLTQAFLWRLVDLEEANGRPIEAVIATKFPSYVVRHPNKVVWLLDRTELGHFDESPEHRAARRAVHELDRVALGEATRLFAASRKLIEGCRRSIGLEPELLPHPPQALPYRYTEVGDFVLSVGRLDRAKRVDLLLDALALSPELSGVVAGEGPERANLEELARRHGLDGRVRFVGRVDGETLADLYARCLAVYYAPVDEGFGMVPYEAFLSEKPVVTTVDAGGPLDVVADRRTGIVCPPEAAALADACAWLRGHREEAHTWGRAGKEVAREVTWDRVFARLLGS